MCICRYCLYRFSSVADGAAISFVILLLSAPQTLARARAKAAATEKKSPIAAIHIYAMCALAKTGAHRNDCSKSITKPLFARDKNYYLNLLCADMGVLRNILSHYSIYQHCAGEFDFFVFLF